MFTGYRPPVTAQSQLNLTTPAAMQENPYLSPVAESDPAHLSRLIPRILFGIAGVLIFLSFPVGWKTLKLANQEYLHMWPIDTTYYGFEINGTPFSNREAVAYGVIAIFVLWLLAGLMIAISRLMTLSHGDKLDREIADLE